MPALDRVQVEVRLEELFCHKQSPFAILEGASEPYVWPLTFVIGGPDLRITEPPEFLLAGDVKVLSTRGGHGNLGGDGNVTDGELVPIPSSVGRFSFTSEAMPLPTPCDPLKPEGVLGLMGVVFVLNEQGNVADNAVLEGYNTLTNGLRFALNDFVNGRSVFAGEPSQAELDALQAELSAEVERAIREQLNILQSIFALPNPDHTIDAKVFTFPLDKLLADGETILNARLKLADPEHDWELRGRILASEPCAFNTLNRSLDRSREGAIDLGAFRAFQTRAVKDKRLNALAWHDLLRQHGPSITRALLTRETRQLAKSVAAGVQAALAAPDRPVPRELLGQIDRLLDAGIKSGSDDARRDFLRLKSVAARLGGRTATQIVEALDQRPPRGVAMRGGPKRPGK